MITTKADAKVEYEKGTKESFTHFELLRMEVDVLKEHYDRLAEILRAAGIRETKEIEAEDFDDDKVFRRLEEMAE